MFPSSTELFEEWIDKGGYPDYNLAQRREFARRFDEAYYWWGRPGPNSPISARWLTSRRGTCPSSRAAKWKGTDSGTGTTSRTSSCATRCCCTSAVLLRTRPGTGRPFDIATGCVYSPPWTTFFRGISPEASKGLTSITIEAEHFRAEHVRPIEKILIASTRLQFLSINGFMSECYSRRYRHADGRRRRQHPQSDIACGILHTLVSRGVHFRELTKLQLVAILMPPMHTLQKFLSTHATTLRDLFLNMDTTLDELSRILAVPGFALDELCVDPNEAMLADEVFAMMGGAGADASKRAARIAHNRAAARLATLSSDVVVRVEPDQDSSARKNRRMGSISAWESVSIRVEGGRKSYRFGGMARACRRKWGRMEPRGPVFVWRFSLGHRHILDTQLYDMWPDWDEGDPGNAVTPTPFGHNLEVFVRKTRDSLGYAQVEDGVVVIPDHAQLLTAAEDTKWIYSRAEEEWRDGAGLEDSVQE